ncbi:helix-turn-helix transcriptional regulator [Gemmata sp. G18]|uniref:Helix-turn-helix transcriptional regulator n=1 Tax=Gemmata palustris TaxID=2822762 RepID=A0ABS5BVH6_9BACT|nr:helix-turn-helix transcriptional regulator [Gemmata palustris]MBP3957737.1 helix-turn-helix transcriptional regulator [Gemmata palustris]
MPLPDITHLQFLLLAALLDGEQSGRSLRALLEQEGHRKSAPAFYQLMARLEESKFVEGRYEQKIVAGQTIKERVYKVAAAGVSALGTVRDFYAGLDAARGLNLGGLSNG